MTSFTFISIGCGACHPGGGSAEYDRVYESGTKFRTIPKHSWEASPYGNVHTYNHDVLPARSALGTKGCTDCHSSRSPIFLRPVLLRPFDAQAKPVFEPQYAFWGCPRGRPGLAFCANNA
ncbi:MAG: hypothetical protein ACTSX8_05425 [Alphaproteobacteria bacterium]